MNCIFAPLKRHRGKNGKQKDKGKQRNKKANWSINNRSKSNADNIPSIQPVGTLTTASPSHNTQSPQSPSEFTYSGYGVPNEIGVDRMKSSDDDEVSLISCSTMRFQSSEISMNESWRQNGRTLFGGQYNIEEDEYNIEEDDAITTTDFTRVSI